MSQRVRVKKLREQKPEDLLKGLEELKKELSTLRTQKVSAGNAQKLSKIKLVRKKIAKHLTVLNLNRRSDLRAQTKNPARLPVDLRPKRTRALRHRLNRHQRAQKTERQWKQVNNFPLRKFAVNE
ncbi:hypothetical protein pb186bvf_007365 [Paramecium bursaria]